MRAPGSQPGSALPEIGANQEVVDVTLHWVKVSAIKPARAVGRICNTVLQLTCCGNPPLRAISYRPPVASAQVKSCVLLAGLCADGPTSVLVGWGMQRRRNGAAIIRAIDALVAVTGNIGIAGHRDFEEKL